MTYLVQQALRAIYPCKLCLLLNDPIDAEPLADHRCSVMPLLLLLGHSCLMMQREATGPPIAMSTGGGISIISELLHCLGKKQTSTFFDDAQQTSYNSRSSRPATRVL